MPPCTSQVLLLIRGKGIFYTTAASPCMVTAYSKHQHLPVSLPSSQCTRQIIFLKTKADVITFKETHSCAKGLEVPRQCDKC